MLKQLKFTAEEAKDIVLISDLHLNHDREFLWGKRKNLFVKNPPFDDCESHKNWILDTWREKLAGKIVFNLGDHCFNDPKGETFTELSQLPCKKHYALWGNHNSGSKYCYEKACEAFYRGFNPDYAGNYSELPELYPVNYNNVTFVGHDLTVRVGKKEIILSHFSKRIWNNMGRGSLHASGHSHSSDSQRNVGCKTQKALDVGVENAIMYDDKFWFTYEEFKSIMDIKTFEKVDHHDPNTNPS